MLGDGGSKVPFVYDIAATNHDSRNKVLQAAGVLVSRQSLLDYRQDYVAWVPYILLCGECPKLLLQILRPREPALECLLFCRIDL